MNPVFNHQIYQDMESLERTVRALKSDEIHRAIRRMVQALDDMNRAAKAAAPIVVNLSRAFHIEEAPAVQRLLAQRKQNE